MRPDPQGWDLVTRRGCRSPVWAWPVKTAAGERMELTGLQRAALFWIRSQVSHGRHRWKIVDLARALECGRGTASKLLAKLRALSLIGAEKPARGRVGGVLVWLPGRASAAREAAARRVRWPSRSNDSTLTTFGGYLSREGLQTAWTAMRGGRPPGSAGPPQRGAAGPRSPRAKGRAWPPAYVDEPCPRGGRRGRLGLVAVEPAGRDAALVFGGRCPRCRGAHVAALVLADPEPSQGLEPIGGRLEPAPTLARIQAARQMIPLVDGADRDELRLRYLGFRRQPLHVPIVPALVDGPLEELDNLVTAARRRCRAELEAVARSRDLVAPLAATVAPGAPGG